MDQVKFENDQFKLTEEKFDLAMVVWKAFQIAKSKANHNQMLLIADIDDVSNLALIQCIQGDQQRLVQILSNFISNSLKFTN